MDDVVSSSFDGRLLVTEDFGRVEVVVFRRRFDF